MLLGARSLIHWLKRRRAQLELWAFWLFLVAIVLFIVVGLALQFKAGNL